MNDFANTRTSRSPVSVAVINYTGDRENWGCQATSRELLKEIEQIFAGDDIEFVLVPLLRTRRIDRWVEKLCGRYLHKTLLKNQLSGFQCASLLLVTSVLYRPYMRRLRRCRYVFFQAEGTMSGRRFSGGLRLLLLPWVAAKVLKKPVFSLNQTIFSAVPDFIPVLVNCYSSFDFVAAREPTSVEYAQNIGLSDVMLVPDSAFETQPARSVPEPVLSLSGKEYFCISGSNLINGADQNLLIQHLFDAARRHALAVVLLCSAQDDLKFLSKLKEFVSRQSQSDGQNDVEVCILPRELDYRDVARVLAGAQFLVSGRYHMAVVGTAVNCPFILLPSGTHKGPGLLQLLQWPLPLRQFDDVAGIGEDIDAIMGQPELFKQHLSQAHQAVCEQKVLGREHIRQRINDYENKRLS